MVFLHFSTLSINPVWYFGSVVVATGSFCPSLVQTRAPEMSHQPIFEASDMVATVVLIMY